jgi:hypothetical protein
VEFSDESRHVRGLDLHRLLSEFLGHYHLDRTQAGPATSSASLELAVFSTGTPGEKRRSRAPPPRCSSTPPPLPATVCLPAVQSMGL